MLSASTKMKLINWWPPVLGSGIRLRKMSHDFRRCEVEMKMRWYNKNLHGIHYGGSLYSMCDPWYMFMLMENLGPGYAVFDKAASIRYLKPGRGTLSCLFEVDQHLLDRIKQEVCEVGKKDFTFLCQVKNVAGETVTEVEKVVYVRKKDFDWSSLK